jgi:hypothetical protein
VKDESVHSWSSTHKDRRSARIRAWYDRLASQDLPDALALITNGNAGYSLVQAMKGTSARIMCVVDEGTACGTIDTLAGAGCDIVTAPLTARRYDSPDIERLCATYGKRVRDVTHGWHDAYAPIVGELTQNPSWIVAPVGSGELLVGLSEGIAARYGTEKGAPRLVGVRAATGNVADKLHAHWTSYQEELDAIGRNGGTVLTLDDIPLQWGAGIVRKALREYNEELVAEPSALAPFAALPYLMRRGVITSRERVVVVTTGYGPHAPALCRA